MARIAGVDIPREKRLEISLTYIFGIGKPTAQKLCTDLGLDRDTKVSALTDDVVSRTPFAIASPSTLASLAAICARAR